MSMFENLSPKHALESLGLRQEPHVVTELVLPLLAAFGIGLGVGAGVALLLAPQSGKELRQDLNRKANRLETSLRSAMPGRHDATADDDMNEGVDHHANTTT